MTIREIVGVSPVIPVLTVSELADGVPLARALVAGGLRVLEVTLRTAAAIGCVEAIRNAVPDAIVGVGALTRAVDFAAAGRAGAPFWVPPGPAPGPAGGGRGARFPLLPGVLPPTAGVAARPPRFNILWLFSA